MRRIARFAGLTVFTVTLIVTPVHAESPDRFCKTYASRAVQQGRVARQVSSCRHLIAETPQRWALNPKQHFAYCMRIYGSGAVMAEDTIRSREIKFCAGP